MPESHSKIARREHIPAMKADENATGVGRYSLIPEMPEGSEQMALRNMAASSMQSGETAAPTAPGVAMAAPPGLAELVSGDTPGLASSPFSDRETPLAQLEREANDRSASPRRRKPAAELLQAQRELAGTLVADVEAPGDTIVPEQFREIRTNPLGVKVEAMQRDAARSSDVTLRAQMVDDLMSGELDVGHWPRTAPELPPTSWQAPSPHRLPELRDRVIQHLQSHHARLKLASDLVTGKGTINPDPDDPDGSAHDMLGDEIARLFDAHLYSITAPMTQFAVAASKNLPAGTIGREELPSVSGFMLFDEPFASYLSPGGRSHSDVVVPIVGVSWGLTRYAVHAFPGRDPREVLWITFWSATDLPRQAWYLRESHDLLLSRGAASRFGTTPLTAKEALSRAGRLNAPVTWDNEMVMTLDDEGEDGDETAGVILVNGMPAGTLVAAPRELLAGSQLPWLAVVRATWLLMKQPKMADTTERPLSTKQAKRARSTGRNGAPVRVVNIHRSAHREETGQREGSWNGVIGVYYFRSHHWKRQPCGPGRQQRKWVFIKDRWCGDPANPVSISKNSQVNLLNRPPAPEQ